MTTLPKISIVTPSFNQGKRIVRSEMLDVRRKSAKGLLVWRLASDRRERSRVPASRLDT